MSKKIILSLLMILLLACGIVLCSCVGTENNASSEVTLSSIAVVESTIPTDAVKGNVDVTLIQLELTYSNGKQERITMDSSMLSEENLEKLNQVGTQLITVVYKNKKAKFQISIHDEDYVFYSLRVYGGVPIAVNGKKLDNVIELTGEYYENIYLYGTVVTIQWLDDGKNFSFWTANDLQVSTESILDVTVDGNLVYRPYSSASVSTVSFKTYTSTVLQSITTNILYENDIPIIYRDNYIFSGWTTDTITEEQSLSGYSRNKVEFPYDIGRSVTFYAIWIPMGVEYELHSEGGDRHYEIVGYHGTANRLELPSKFNGLDVTVIKGNAFDGAESALLRSISLPASLETIEEGAFKNCSHVEAFYVEDGGRYRALDGVLFSADGTELVAYPANKVSALYVVPSAVKKLDAYAFNNVLVGSIKLSSATEYVGRRCFDTVYLDHIDFSAVNPVGISIDDVVFNEKLDAVLFSASGIERFRYMQAFLGAQQKLTVSADEVHSVYAHTYEEGDGQMITVLYRIVYDKNLVDASVITNDKESYATAEILGIYRGATTFAIPIRLAQPGEKAYIVTSLADYAMKGCVDLRNVVISFSSRLARVGDEVFTDTPWLKNLGSDVLQANNVIFKYLGTSETYVMGTNVEKIAEGAFRNNKYIKYVNIGANASLKTIAPYAFMSCTSFVGFICDANPDGEGVYLKYMTQKIGEYAFYDTAVTSLKLQVSEQQQLNLLFSIGEYAFGKCKYLKKVTLSASTRDIASTAFVECISLQEFVMDEIAVNTAFRVYEGILYGYDSQGRYTVFCYPAGRVDGEFDPAIVRSYGYALEYTLTGYTGNSDDEIGSIYFNGAPKGLYLTICTTEEWKTNYDPITGKYSLLFEEGGSLRPSTVVKILQDGSVQPNGDYYFSINVESIGRVPLCYDETKDAFYYYPQQRYYIDDISVNYHLYGALDTSVETEVGTFDVRGKTFSVYLKVKEGIEIKSGRDYVPVDNTTGQKLLQTTRAYYDENGALVESSIDGDFYFYFYYSEISAERTVLLFDSDRSVYYFVGNLDVEYIGDNAFSYSAISGVTVSSLVKTIGNNAFDVPGLLYVKFATNPAIYSFDEMIGDYLPKNVVMSDRVSYSDKVLFFGSYSDIMDDMVAAVSYRFVYDDRDSSILYAIDLDNNNMYVARSSRIEEFLLIQEYVQSGETSYLQVKKVLPYAFYGVYLDGVTLRGVDSLASHSFSEAVHLTKLYIETEEFISDLQQDTFGVTFHNGMYIYDSRNTLNLYKGSNWVPSGTLFTYYDRDGSEMSSCPYLILNEEKLPFAVITYVDNYGEIKTADILYGVITAENVAAIQAEIARTGYDISGWEIDGEGGSISTGTDYTIPCNQVLSCVWSAQVYTVYFIVKEGEEVKKATVDDEGNIVEGADQTLSARKTGSGLVTYQSTIAYNEKYMFVMRGFDEKRVRFVCWSGENGVRYGSGSTTAVWNKVIDGVGMNLYPVTETRMYTLTYVIDSDVTIEASEKLLPYGVADYQLDVPTCEGYAFMGWYVIIDSQKVILTNERGNPRVSWLYSDSEEYEVYALWSTILVYPTMEEVSVRYGEYFRISVPSDESFDGWYIMKDGVKTKITDATGESIGVWTFEGKRKFNLLREEGE